MSSSVNLSPGGPPEVVLPPESAVAVAALSEALARPPADRRDAVAAVVTRFPRWSEAWACLGELGRDPVERYAAYRVGYHRGLDMLRQNGWRGTGYVRWRHETNRGVLRSIDGLRQSAIEIGERDEVERCATFLRQLDPEWPPADVSP